MREEVIGNATLYLGDCREIVGGLQAEAVITDPVWPNCPPDLLIGSDRPHDLFDDFCGLIPSSVRRLAIELRNDSDPRFLFPVPDRLTFIQVMWCQYVMPGYLGRVLGGNECVYVFGEPVAKRAGRNVVPSVSPKAQPSDRPPNGHPCSRALVHQEFIVNWCSDDWETVCDPFMGSGTTGVACARIGRRFVGVEIEEKYFSIACKRIEAAYNEPQLPLAEPRPKPALLPGM